MGDFEVKITGQAYWDMARIRDYIMNELLSPQAAAHVVDLLEDAVKSLASLPGRNRVIDDYPWKSFGIRKLRAHSFYIYYWIDDKNKKVQIISVLHAKQNQLSNLSKINFK